MKTMRIVRFSIRNIPYPPPDMVKRLGQGKCRGDEMRHVRNSRRQQLAKPKNETEQHQRQWFVVLRVHFKLILLDFSFQPQENFIFNLRGMSQSLRHLWLLRKQYLNSALKKKETPASLGKGKQLVA